MNEKASERLISRMCNHESFWRTLISHSFLPEELKPEYNALLDILRNG